MHTPLVAIFGFPGGSEWIVIGLVALLLFGRRLPDVARSMGRSITEFKKGLRDMKDDVDHASETPKRIAPPRDDDDHRLPASHPGAADREAVAAKAHGSGSGSGHDEP
ncbi:MAG: twin-arginine translocase TatA/TatE family subunit [Phycisphaerales bacterium]|nr:twin-arginine translocase TatA/TatE family subunit [Phycisphaerales bacterium]